LWGKDKKVKTVAVTKDLVIIRAQPRDNPDTIGNSK
jgi:hypothetical protein